MAKEGPSQKTLNRDDSEMRLPASEPRVLQENMKFKSRPPTLKADNSGGLLLTEERQVFSACQSSRLALMTGRGREQLADLIEAQRKNEEQ